MLGQILFFSCCVIRTDSAVVFIQWCQDLEVEYRITGILILGFWIFFLNICRSSAYSCLLFLARRSHLPRDLSFHIQVEFFSIVFLPMLTSDFLIPVVPSTYRNLPNEFIVSQWINN